MNTNILIIILAVIVLVQVGFIYSMAKYLLEFLKNVRVSNGEIVQNVLSLGEPVPLFREKNYLGRSISLADNGGKDTFILFAGKDCSLCKDIIDNLATFHEKYNFRVLVISGKELGIESRYSGIEFLVSNSIFQSYMIKNVPTSLLINSRNHLALKLNVTHTEGININLADYYRNVS